MKIPTKFRSAQPTSISSDDAFSEESLLLQEMEEQQPREKKKQRNWYLNQFKHYVFQYRAVFGVGKTVLFIDTILTYKLVVCVLIGSIFLSGLFPWDDRTANVPEVTKTQSSTSIVDTTKIGQSITSTKLGELSTTSGLSSFKDYIYKDRIGKLVKLEF